MTRRSKRQRDAHALILKRSRERRRNGRRIALVEYDADDIDLLVRHGLLGDGVTDAPPNVFSKQGAQK